jgi:hypothetical protein
MSLRRRFAVTLLRLAVRRSNDWAVAMSNELDAVEDDWAAMQWAVGCTCVIVKHAATEVLSGVAVAAAVLALCVGGLSRLVPLHAVAAQWLTSIVLPESVFVVAALALWHRRRSTAMGFALSALLLVAHVCLWVTASAQTPRPEVQKLGYFIGTWHAEGEMKASMFGPAGKVTNVTRNEWMLNKFFYITHHEEHNPAGAFAMVNITGYDPEKKKYVEYEFDGQGGTGRSEGTFDGTTWTWTSEFIVNGQTVRSRGTVKPTSATSYDFTWEIAPHGADWTLVQQGKATKS